MIPAGRVVMTLSIARRIANYSEVPAHCSSVLDQCGLKVCICNTGILEMVKKVFGIQVTGPLWGYSHSPVTARRSQLDNVWSDLQTPARCM